MARNAREAVNDYWVKKLGDLALGKRQSLLELFSETTLLKELRDLRMHAGVWDHKSHSAGDLSRIQATIPLQHAKQTLVWGLLDIVSQDGNNRLNFDDMSHITQVFDQVAGTLQSASDIGVQTSQLELLTTASKWQFARIFHLCFYWFTTVGPQISSTLISQVSAYTEDSAVTPLEKLAQHIFKYIKCRVGFQF